MLDSFPSGRDSLAQRWTGWSTPELSVLCGWLLLPHAERFVVGPGKGALAPLGFLPLTLFRCGARHGRTVLAGAWVLLRRGHRWRSMPLFRQLDVEGLPNRCDVRTQAAMLILRASTLNMLACHGKQIVMLGNTPTLDKPDGFSSITPGCLDGAQLIPLSMCGRPLYGRGGGWGHDGSPFFLASRTGLLTILVAFHTLW